MKIVIWDMQIIVILCFLRIQKIMSCRIDPSSSQTGMSKIIHLSSSYKAEKSSPDSQRRVVFTLPLSVVLLWALYNFQESWFEHSVWRDFCLYWLIVTGAKFILLMAPKLEILMIISLPSSKFWFTGCYSSCSI